MSVTKSHKKNFISDRSRARDYSNRAEKLVKKTENVTAKVTKSVAADQGFGGIRGGVKLRRGWTQSG